jgi:uroporphyrinogen-III synthase
VTRAEPGAARTAARLAALGFDPVIAPLLEIRPLLQPAPVLDGIAALAFTSINGVAAFARLSERRDRAVFTVGEATAAAARGAGFGTVRSADGALGDLAALLRSAGVKGVVLAPGAREPAGDLAALLAGSGIEARPLAVYETVETEVGAPAAFDAVLIHSPRAGRALAARPGEAGSPRRVVVAISAAAAEALSPRSFAEIRIAAHPDEDGVLEALGNPSRAV